jgi:hypothetical protein
MKRHRLRAPSADGALFAHPPLSEAGARLAQNVAHMERWDHDFQGRKARFLRGKARADALVLAAQYLERFGLPAAPLPAPSAPWIVAGHQPELYHAGVWAKNFGLWSLAQSLQAVPLNFVVDNDIPKSASIRVPSLTPQGLRAQTVPFDSGAGEVPYEDLATRDETLFDTFAERSLEVLGGLVPDPILRDYWPRVLRLRERTDRTGLRFALARRELEADWGARNWEAPLSALCETEAFLWFASHLLAHLDRFQEVHNAALLRYRKLYRIRSTHHPVPALGREGQWLEAPFWVWRADRPRRRPLWVRQLARTMELRAAGDDAPFLELPLTAEREACCAVEALRTLPERNIRLRTRALTTTLFARLLLADAFVHGIGGAKYDELGNEIVRGFFGIEPPTHFTLSLTLWLGLPVLPATRAQLHEVERGLRDLRYNPDRHLAVPLDPALADWIEAKSRAIAAPVDTHRHRVARFQEIRRANEALEPAAQAARPALEQTRDLLLAGLKHNAVATNRESSFVLHSQRRLREALDRLLPPAAPIR